MAADLLYSSSASEVAQSAEQVPLEHKVEGSSPSLAEQRIKKSVSVQAFLFEGVNI